MINLNIFRTGFNLIGLFALCASAVLMWAAFNRPVCPMDGGSCSPHFVFLIVAFVAGLIGCGILYASSSS